MMVGTCYICSAPAMFTCVVCGRMVCIQCYHKGARLCTNCLQKFKREIPGGGDDPTEPAQFESGEEESEIVEEDEDY